MASYFDEHNTEEEARTEREDPDTSFQYPFSLVLRTQIESIRQLLRNNENAARAFLLGDAAGSPAAAAEVIAALPKIDMSSEPSSNPAVCPICSDEYSEEKVATKLPCKHCFHHECIVQWLTKRNTCPMCRSELPTDDPVYEEEKRNERRRRDAEEMYTSSMYT
eukprot:CAMPEP_0198723942 /NCGR_PEP_ID=MMETSP1475-20131203/1455_1 /TAXON_ID= ORGANISM="Unidentified sp., Strain CCMP1999" /NCGR_SAMPLE_ID=MMETSP1475 /ASSEMBLY_ACC=CAM_ASM_001111 /LENGTH=163 /DNA_ID=CAMNT_0044485285 /DNA_START=28 /DNA_END=519 /DNA_ORIENTATION=+